MIKFIRQYDAYGKTWFEVVYHSGRICTYFDHDLPLTACEFLVNSNWTKQYDKIFKREEIIYK